MSTFWHEIMIDYQDILYMRRLKERFHMSHDLVIIEVYILLLSQSFIQYSDKSVCFSLIIFQINLYRLINLFMP